MAQETQYQVKADLVFDANRAKTQATQMASKIRQLGSSIKGTSSLAGGLTRNLIAIGGAYVGINALVRGFSSLTRGAVTYASELEQVRIGLTSVLAAVQGTDWDTAARTSGRVFEQVRQDSIKSVATAQQLFKIYQGIVGPIAKAGVGLDVVRKLTLDTVNAANVLGVDLAQAQRDISMMVRGTAGMDVKLFSMLRATGAIVEDTKKWNMELTAAERVDKLQAALAKFGSAGTKFAKSFAGVTSTFKGIRQEFTRSAFQPIMDAMASSLFRINDILIRNQDVIQERLVRWGKITEIRLAKVFDVAERGAMMVAQRWDEITARITKAMELMKTVGKVALAGAAVQVARPVVGAAVGGIGALAGTMAASQAAAATGAAAAGGAAVGGGALLGGLAPALAVVTVAAVALGAAFLVIKEQWGNFQSMLTIASPILQGLGTDLMELGKMIIGMLKPALKIAGHLLLGAFVVGLTAGVAVLRVWIKYLTEAASAIAYIANVIYDAFLPAFNAMWGVIQDFVAWAVKIVNFVTGDIERLNAKAKPKDVDDTAFMVDLAKQYGGESRLPGHFPGRMASIPDQRKQAPVFDFKGAKIVVKQTFKDMDPDRVMIAMKQGLARQAEMRIQSGMLPALGR